VAGIAEPTVEYVWNSLVAVSPLSCGIPTLQGVSLFHLLVRGRVCVICSRISLHLANMTSIRGSSLSTQVLLKKSYLCVVLSRLTPIYTTYGQLYIMSSTGLMSHSSWMISDDVALASGSQVNIFRMNFKNISFSSPGGIVVTKSSKEVLGIGISDIQLPVVIECQAYLVQSSDSGLRIGNWVRNVESYLYELNIENLPSSSKYVEESGLCLIISGGGRPR